MKILLQIFNWRDLSKRVWGECSSYTKWTGETLPAKSAVYSGMLLLQNSAPWIKRRYYHSEKKVIVNHVLRPKRDKTNRCKATVRGKSFCFKVLELLILFYFIVDENNFDASFHFEPPLVTVKNIICTSIESCWDPLKTLGKHKWILSSPALRNKLLGQCHVNIQTAVTKPNLWEQLKNQCYKLSLLHSKLRF